MTRIALSGILTPAAIIVVVLLAASFSVHGISVDDYKSKVDRAWALALEVESPLRNSEIDHAELRGFVEHIRSNFPAAEKVDLLGSEVEVSNTWLLEKNTQLEKETDLDGRLAILVEMREHLSAVAVKLYELQSAAAADRTKDEDKRKLAEILRREEYQKPEPKDETGSSGWFARFLEWLDSLFQGAETKSNTPLFGGLGMVFQMLLYIGIFALIVVIAVKVLPRFIRNARPRKEKKRKDRIILGEKLADDETAVDVLAEAERLAREGNLRGAIRKGYIALLCELSDRKVLGLARHKTNRDYLRDVRTRADLHPRMKVVTDTFERHWYGFEESVENDWAEFRADYERVMRSV